MTWIYESWSVLWHAATSTVVLLLIMIGLVRLNGLRSFAKMTSIDFVTTITAGSVINSTIMSDTNSIFKGGLVIGILLLVQTIFSKMRMRKDWFGKYTENKPLLLMKDGDFLQDNLKKSNVSKSDIIAKLREANALKLEQVHAVILETTGDISVLHGGEKPEPKCILYDDVVV